MVCAGEGVSQPGCRGGGVQEAGFVHSRSAVVMALEQWWAPVAWLW